MCSARHLYTMIVAFLLPSLFFQLLNLPWTDCEHHYNTIHIYKYYKETNLHKICITTTVFFSLCCESEKYACQYISFQTIHKVCEIKYLSQKRTCINIFQPSIGLCVRHRCVLAPSPFNTSMDGVYTRQSCRSELIWSIRR